MNVLISVLMVSNNESYHRRMGVSYNWRHFLLRWYFLNGYGYTFYVVVYNMLEITVRCYVL